MQTHVRSLDYGGRGNIGSSQWHASCWSPLFQSKCQSSCRSRQIPGLVMVARDRRANQRPKVSRLKEPHKVWRPVAPNLAPALSVHRTAKSAENRAAARTATRAGEEGGRGYGSCKEDSLFQGYGTLRGTWNAGGTAKQSGGCTSGLGSAAGCEWKVIP